jgi:hypothetical protein
MTRARLVSGCAPVRLGIDPLLLVAERCLLLTGDTNGSSSSLAILAQSYEWTSELWFQLIEESRTQLTR